MSLQTAMQGRPRKVRDRRLESVETVIRRQQCVPAKGDNDGSSSSPRTVERGSLGPVLRSSTDCRLRHLATVFGSMPNSRPGSAVEACDRCIAALMACVAVAQP